MKCLCKSKRKNGNVILMVLMVATVMIILSAVVSSALVFTTQGNTIVKYKNDYVYAAEGGIDYGIEKISKTGAFTGNVVAGVDTGIRVDFLSDLSVTGDKEIYEVRVVCKVISSGYELISTVYNKNGEVLGRITQPLTSKVGISKILEYTVCSASKIKLHCGGGFSFNPSKVAFNNPNYDVVGSPFEPNKVDKVDVNKPEYSNYVVKSVDNIEFETLDKLLLEARKCDPTNPTYNPIASRFTHMTTTTNNENDGKLVNGLGYYKLKSKKADGSDNTSVAEINVIFISRKNLIITGGTLKNLQSTLSNTVIVCDGKIICYGSALNLSRSTIYSSEIEMELSGSLTMQGSPLYATGEDNTPSDNSAIPNGNLTTTDVDNFDKLLIKYCSSYGADSDLGGRPTVDSGDIKYEF